MQSFLDNVIRELSMGTGSSFVTSVSSNSVIELPYGPESPYA